MSDPILQPVSELIPPPGPGLSQIQRVIYTFTAPSKTFNDIKAGHRSWWMPFLITVVVGYMFFAAVYFKIGMKISSAWLRNWRRTRFILVRNRSSNWLTLRRTAAS